MASSAKSDISHKPFSSPKQQFPSPKGETTYCNQHKLAPLPVPPLDHTCNLYYETLSPLLTESELTSTKRAIEEFLKGIGPTLQKRLEERSKQQWKLGKNWLEDWWFDWAYLKWPDPIVINSNFYEVAETPAFKIGMNQAFCAARLIYGVRQFLEFMRSERRAPEYLGKDPLCMNQFRSLFTTARIPGENGDKLMHFTPSDEILVLCRKQFYMVPLYHQGKPLTSRDMEVQMNFILEDTKKYSQLLYGLGLMTASNRQEWARMRQEMSKSIHNARNFERIDACAFVIVLDDAKPVTENETGELSIAGDANNRWFDKIVQYIIFANGRVGVNGEHSPVDAPCTEQIANYMMDTLRDLQDNEYPDFGQTISFPQPQRVHWEMEPKHYQILEKAQTEYDKLRASHDLCLMRYRAYGVDYIKKLGFSPDSYIQMGFQLAYYKMFKKPCATYETGQTRLFRNGRTETVRSCSKESYAWTKAMLDPNVSKETRAQLLKEAINSHKNYMNKATRGMACDRHLLGLRILAAEAMQKGEITDMPSIFKDPAYAKSTTWYLSTSNMGNSEGYYVGGFGCYLPGSVGVCYQPWNTSMHFSIVTRRQPGPAAFSFEQALTESFNEMKDLFPVPSKL